MNDQSNARARQTGPALEAHYQFILWLVPTLERFPRSQKFLLGGRIQNTALNVLESLIEATYTRQRSQHLSQANLGLEKLRFTREKVVARVCAWIAHADHANTWRLRHTIFRGGWFDPLWKPDRLS